MDREQMMKVARAALVEKMEEREAACEGREVDLHVFRAAKVAVGVIQLVGMVQGAAGEQFAKIVSITQTSIMEDLLELVAGLGDVTEELVEGLGESLLAEINGQVGLLNAATKAFKKAHHAAS